MATAKRRYKTYLFEGEHLTVNQVKLQVPAIGEPRIKRMLERGISSKEELIAEAARYNHSANSSKYTNASPWMRQSVARSKAKAKAKGKK